MCLDQVQAVGDGFGHLGMISFAEKPKIRGKIGGAERSTEGDIEDLRLAPYANHSPESSGVPGVEASPQPQ